MTILSPVCCRGSDIRAAFFPLDRSARVPQTSTRDVNDFAALNEAFDTVTELNVEAGSPTAKEITKSFSEDAAHAVDAGASFDLSHNASIFSRDEESSFPGGMERERPATVMTDDIDKLPELDSNFNSLQAEDSVEQPILSNINADTFYYRQSMSPTVQAKTGDVQRKLNDTYVEYDSINAIHFSPAKKDPERVAFLANIYQSKVDITAERTKGYGDTVRERTQRADRISQKARAQVTAILENKTAMAKNMARYKLDKGGNLASIKIGKMDRRPPLHQPHDPNPLLTALETFSLSPLNKQLVLPEVNADGSPNRKPPDPRVEFFKDKAKKARREKKEKEREQRRWQAEQLELQQAKDYFRKHGRLPPPQSYTGRKLVDEDDEKNGVSEYGDDDIKMAATEAVEMARQSVSDVHLDTREAVVNGRQDDQRSDDGSEIPSTEASAPGSSESGEGVGPPDKWGWHNMRARSAKHGNIPSLPFRGPPYVMDIKLIKRNDGRVLGTSVEHRDSVHKVFSPAVKSIQSLTSLW